MAMAVVDEAIRNLVVVGADPSRVVLLDNFSWGDPRRPSTLGELVAAVDGCVRAAELFAAPFVSGKDSLNNEFTGADGRRQSVPPTLVITAVAPVPDVVATVTAETMRPGDVILAVGKVEETWGGSHAALITGATGEDARVVADLPADLPARYRAVHELIRDGLILAAHDVSEGGLAVALAEMAIAGGHGLRCEPMEHAVMHRDLFAEGPGRLVLEVAPEDVDAVVERIPGPCRIVARVEASATLVLPDGAVASLDELSSVWGRR
jgi:phosphoribosylformylglycinamidine synthase